MQVEGSSSPTIKVPSDRDSKTYFYVVLVLIPYKKKRVKILTSHDAIRV